MSKKANPAVIGGFVIGAVTLAVAGVLILGGGEFFKTKRELVLYFDESVKGLEKGSPVTFRGITIGQVTDVRALVDPETLSFGMEVFVEYDPGKFTLTPGKHYERIRDEDTLREFYSKLIEKGLRAQLETKSLVTGQLLVNLDLHPDTPARLRGRGDIPEIPTIRSSMGALVEKLKGLNLDQLSAKLTSLIEGLDHRVNSPQVAEIIKTLDQALKHLDQLIVNLDTQVEPLAAGAQGTLKNFSALARNADQEIRPLTAKAQAALGEIQGLVKNVNKQVEPLSSKAGGALDQGRKTLTTAEGLIEDDSPMVYNLETTLKELSSAARAIRVWAEYLERHPEALLRGKGGR